MNINLGSIVWLWVYLGASLWITSCEVEPPTQTESGLTHWSLNIDSDNLGLLNNSVSAKYPVHGKLKLDGSSYAVKVNYAGKSTLDAMKKSYDVVFQDRPYRGRWHWRLSAQYSDPTVIKAKLGFEVFAAAGVPSPEVDFISVTINDASTGLYQLQEMVDTDFYQSRGIGVQDLFKAKFNNADFGPEFLNRLDAAYIDKLDSHNWSKIRQLWLEVASDNPSIDRLSELINIDIYLRYIAACVVLNHFDGFGNNYYLASPGQAQPFTITPWDLDRMYEEGQAYKPGVSPYGDNYLTQVLLSSDEIRSRYLTQLRSLLTSDVVQNLGLRAAELREATRLAYQQDQVLANRFDFDLEHQKLQDHISNWLSQLNQELRELE